VRLPPTLTRLRIKRSWVGFIPPTLVQRINPLRPRLRQLFLSALPGGDWANIGDEGAWELE
jgi:hypothetical protein